MDIAFWAARWREGRIGFHEGRTNTFLERYVSRLGPAPRRVFVPLCGKTEDMAFLAGQGHEVVGVEVVEDAVKAFFAEHSLVPRVKDVAEHIRSYAAAHVEILAGDILACTPELVGAVDAFYDRAALIALSDDVRPRYVAHLRRLLAPRSKGLLITAEYDTSKVEPPPHSVPEAEVRSLYAGAGVTQLEEGLFTTAKFRDAGVTATERCFAIEL